MAVSLQLPWGGANKLHVIAELLDIPSTMHPSGRQYIKTKTGIVLKVVLLLRCFGDNCQQVSLAVKLQIKTPDHQCSVDSIESEEIFYDS